MSEEKEESTVTMELITGEKLFLTEGNGIYRIVVSDSKVTQIVWITQAELDEIARQISKFRTE